MPTDSTMENGGWIGVRGKGVKVVHVTDGGPADKAGVREGDRIQSFRGVRVFEGLELKRLVAETPIGKTVPVVVSRTGETTTLYVTVASRPTETAATTDKLHSVDVTGFDVLGLKLYMTPDQVMHVLRSKNPKARISMGKTLCANEEREYIMTGAGYPKPKGTCVSWIHFAQRGKVGEYTINIGFIEDFPNNLSQSFVIYITYEFSPSLKRDSSKATKAAVIKKYGKPSWIQPYARGEEFPAVIWWGKLKRDWRKINREWECWVGNVPQPRSNVKTWGTDRCGMLPGGMPIDQNQASLRFGGSGVFIVYLSDRDLESRMYRAKKEYIKSKPVSTTVPKF